MAKPQPARPLPLSQFGLCNADAAAALAGCDKRVIKRAALRGEIRYTLADRSKFGNRVFLFVVEDVEKFNPEATRVGLKNAQKVTPEQEQRIRARYAEGGITQGELAEHEGLGTATISRILRAGRATV